MEVWKTTSGGKGLGACVLTAVRAVLTGGPRLQLSRVLFFKGIDGFGCQIDGPREGVKRVLYKRTSVLAGRKSQSLERSVPRMYSILSAADRVAVVAALFAKHFFLHAICTPIVDVNRHLYAVRSTCRRVDMSKSL